MVWIVLFDEFVEYFDVVNVDFLCDLLVLNFGIMSVMWIVVVVIYYLFNDI